MQQLGYVEGQTLMLDMRWAEGRNELFERLANELIALKPDVIVADSTPAALAVARATKTIPIVMANVSDPVSVGLVKSLAHPGGNVTGVTDHGIEMSVKGVELLQAVVPRLGRLAVLMSTNPAHAVQLADVQKAAARSGLTVLPTVAKSMDELESAFVSMVRQNAGAVIVLDGAPFSTADQRDLILEFAGRSKLPAMYPSSWWVEAGGLVSYGVQGGYAGRLAATYVHQILRGAKPSDLPVQQPAEFELVVNLKTAKTLGLTIPPSLLQRADRVIE
jgi:putative ABC transport system substrate-binding protein